MGNILAQVLMIGIMIGAMLAVWLHEPTEPDTSWTCKCVETAELTCVKQVCVKDAKE